jgi:hypothetical protein
MDGEIDCASGVVGVLVDGLVDGATNYASGVAVLLANGAIDCVGGSQDGWMDGSTIYVGGLVGGSIMDQWIVEFAMLVDPRMDSWMV